MAHNKYTTTQGDTWDLISFKMYDDEHYIDRLIKANPQYRNTTIFSANVELIIPELEIESMSNLPPWKRVSTS